MYSIAFDDFFVKPTSILKLQLFLYLDTKYIESRTRTDFGLTERNVDLIQLS